MKNSSFFDNKAAVAGVFGSLGFIAFCAIVGLVIWTNRRIARNSLPQGTRYDTSVSPFFHLFEERRGSISPSAVARILDKEPPLLVESLDEEVNDGSSITQSKPPPYDRLSVNEPAGLPYLPA